MKIIEYFTSDNKEYWLTKISDSDWGAGQFLAKLLRENKLKETVGETAIVPMLTDGKELVSFCTLAPLDEIQPTEYSPWIGFVYTFPKYRGHRYAGILLDYAESIATIIGKEYVYISTGDEGLYEKYGYEFFKMAKSIWGEETRVYRKELAIDGEDKERRMKVGEKYKADIVAKARMDIEPVSYCGFSCNHCFLGQWCGGCRSSFNCCSFGTMFEKGKCPNAVCCNEKGIEGCYVCDELESCNKGFYKDGNDGANACKAQAIFIKKQGKEIFLKVHDKLHEKYEFQKIQEILNEDINKSLQMLESLL